MADTPGAPKSPWEEKLEQRRQRYRDKLERRRLRWEARRARWGARGVGGPHFRTGFGGAFIGLILAGVGILLLLQNLGIIVVEDLWDYWPVILIMLGFAKALHSWSVFGRIWGVVIAGVGAVFLLRNLNIIHANVWGLFWPAILIAIGLGMLLRAFDSGGQFWPWAYVHPDKVVTDESTVNSVNIDAVFSHAERHFDTQAFEGGEVNAVFGGVDLDLSKASIKAERVQMECNAVFGGVDIRVPEGWTVIMRGTGVFGGFSDETHPPVRGDAKSPTLLVTGGAVFGGVTVKN